MKKKQQDVYMVDKKKFRRVLLLLFLCMTVSCHTVVSAVDEKIEEKYTAVPETTSPLAADPGYYPSQKGFFKTSVSIDLQSGYDNNVDLDPNRNKDGFLQSFANIQCKYGRNEDFKFSYGVDVFEIIYYKFNRNNLLDVVPFAGFDWWIVPGLKIRTQAALDYFSYPNNKENSYTGLEMEAYVRHYILENIYHEFGYTHYKRWYPDRKIATIDAVRGNEDRFDIRDKVEYTFAAVISDRALLKLGNELYYNDSNDSYQDYYDYLVYKIRPSLMCFITDRFYAYTSFLFKLKDYKDRRSSEDVGRVTGENAYTFNFSLYYDITDNTTFEVMYTYNENDPDDPFYKYSGSVVTGGIYYTF